MDPAQPPSLAVDGLHLWRGMRHVLRGLAFEVQGGELVHLKGPNGAGKTSLLRTLAGFLWPEEGAILWCGLPIEHDRDAFGRAIAYLGHDNALKADLTARENLRFAANLRFATAEAELDAALQAVGVIAHADRPVRVLSAGQKRRVAMARVLLSKATLWLLDEPFTNLDVAATADLAQLVDAHAGQGGMAIVTSHSPMNLPEGRVRDLLLA